jgi:hypothetical protein
MIMIPPQSDKICRFFSNKEAELYVGPKKCKVIKLPTESKAKTPPQKASENPTAN